MTGDEHGTSQADRCLEYGDEDHRSLSPKRDQPDAGCGVVDPRGVRQHRRAWEGNAPPGCVMATRTGIAILRQMVDSHLQGIPDTTIPAADRDRAIREAADRYGRDVPRRRATDVAGDGGAYYLLHGRAIDLAETL